MAETILKISDCTLDSNLSNRPYGWNETTYMSERYEPVISTILCMLEGHTVQSGWFAAGKRWDANGSKTVTISHSVAGAIVLSGPAFLCTYRSTIGQCPKFQSVHISNTFETSSASSLLFHVSYPGTTMLIRYPLLGCNVQLCKSSNSSVRFEFVSSFGFLDCYTLWTWKCWRPQER